MATKRNVKKLGVDIPADLVDRFYSWCSSTHRTRTGSVCVALELLLRTPIQLRELAMSGRWDQLEQALARLEQSLAESGKPAPSRRLRK